MAIKNKPLFLLMAVLALFTLSCGLSGGLLGDAADEDSPAADSGGDQPGSPVDSDSEDGLQVASPEELNSYRLHITWRGGDKDGNDAFVMSFVQEWVKEPPAQHFVMSGAEPGQDPVPMMEYIVIGDQAWMGVGGTWVESEFDQAQDMAGAWGAMMGDTDGWELVGSETVNDVRCKHYTSGDKSSVSLADPEEGGTVKVAVQGESWVADEGNLPPVIIRERIQIEGGFFPFAVSGGPASPETEEGVFFFEYDLTDINTTIVIRPPEELGQLPVEPPAEEPPSGEGQEDEPDLPPPPAETQTRVRAADGMVMHYLPPGPFMMGDDYSPFAPERPEHLVILDGFWIDETEVTNAQYRRCVEAGVCGPAQSWDKPDLAGDSQPALTMWTQAQAYCQWVGGRLPTEAEWEKAARGTDARLWPWGHAFEDGKANLSGQEDGYKATAPVGSFPGGASPYGLLDMAGNAAEWVADWYGQDYYAQSPERNPTGPAGGEQKVIRSTIANGGGGPEKCRTVARYPAIPDAPNWINGFRCAMTTQP